MSANNYVLFLTSEAEVEIVDAVVWYEEQQTGLGERFEIEIRKSFKRILENPLTNAKIHGEKRRAKITHFPYGIYYQLIENDVIVLAVVSYLRNPNLWKSK
ncbi:MAG: type II toxin-antitoxin system RelE/ParE family toxin [Salibacteraceae bacterium]|nr:type II toxin-antitoxin system RelE/ParE family toxin [Salibacteraceae bacterium]